MNPKTLKTILQIAGLVISGLGLLVDAKVSEQNTQKAVNQYMDGYMKAAMEMAQENNQQNSIEENQEV